MYANNIIDITHFCGCFPSLKQNLTFSRGILWPKRKFLPSCAATNQMINAPSLAVCFSDTRDVWSYISLNK
jgi:hypothetical protein